GCDHRTLHRQRLHEDDRQALGEARQDQRARVADRFEYVLVALPAEQLDPIAQVAGLDGGFDLRAERAVADQVDFEVDAFLCEAGGGFDQDEVAFGRAEAADADEAWITGRRGFGGVEELFIQAAVDDLDLVPVFKLAPAAGLALAETADHADERTAADFFRD